MSWQEVYCTWILSLRLSTSQNTLFYPRGKTSAPCPGSTRTALHWTIDQLTSCFFLVCTKYLIISQAPPATLLMICLVNFICSGLSLLTPCHLTYSIIAAINFGPHHPRCFPHGFSTDQKNKRVTSSNASQANTAWR